MADLAPSVVIYDGTCGFCRVVIHFLVDRFSVSATVKPWQSVDLAGYGITEDEARKRMWFVRDGARFGGARAFAEWARTGDRRARYLGRVLRLPGVAQVAAIVYELVARNRHRIPGPWENRCSI